MILSGNQILREIRTQNAVVRKLSNGVVHMFHPSHITSSNMDNFVENYEAFLKIQEGEISPFLFNTGSVISVGRKEKRFMTEKLPTVATRMAIVSESQNPLVLYTINIYLSLFTPTIPHKMFQNEKEAYGWIVAPSSVE